MNEIFTRRSVRKFLPTMVEDEKIELLLRAGMAAPSMGNQPPWEFYVVRDKRVIQDLSRCSPYAGCAANAPAAIVVCSRDTNQRFPAFVNLDLSACVENILLEAVHLELGAVWIGVSPYKSREVIVRRAVGVPEGFTPFAIVSFGYPKDSGNERLKEDRYDPSRVHYL